MSDLAPEVQMKMLEYAIQNDLLKADCTPSLLIIGAAVFTGFYVGYLVRSMLQWQ